MGFGGLLCFTFHELCYELCGWLISNYDITYHRLNMATNIDVRVNEEHVCMVMRILSNGVDMIVYNGRATSNRTYTLSLLEQNLQNLLVGNEFIKTLLILSCATMLAPNSKLKGMHDL